MLYAMCHALSASLVIGAALKSRALFRFKADFFQASVGVEKNCQHREGGEVIVKKKCHQGLKWVSDKPNSGHSKDTIVSIYSFQINLFRLIKLL